HLRAGEEGAALRHGAAVDQRCGVARDEDEDLGRIGEADRGQGEPAQRVVGDVVDEDQEQREAPEEVEPEVALGIGRRHPQKVMVRAGPGQGPAARAAGRRYGSTMPPWARQVAVSSTTSARLGSWHGAKAAAAATGCGAGGLAAQPRSAPARTSRAGTRSI